jgi:3-mercaptopyruvate sulfurtransferase SseA
MLIERGFTLIRPLAGGLEAWVDAGYPVEAESLIAIRAGASPSPPHEVARQQDPVPSEHSRDGR